MGKSNESGLQGERKAADYLLDKGWEIKAMNYRYKRCEIDLVASKDNMLVFFEVKKRASVSFGQPEDFVNRRKADRIISAAEHFIDEVNWQGNIRFDIIAIAGANHEEIMHFEDAFY